MSEPTTSPNKRRARQDDAQPTLAEGRWKRRAFLQTMGQQLREFGTDGTSPRDLSRAAFGTSPSNQCGPAVSGTTTVQRGPAGAGTAHIDTPESDAAPGEDDQLPAGAAKSASKWLWSIDEVSSMATPESGRSFTFEDLLGWSQSYFDHWHPSFPFIHAPSLLEYFRQVTQSGSSSNDSAAFMHTILRSVVSISLMDRRQMASPKQAVPSSIVFHTFNDTINSIQRVLTEESSILSLQALISVQLFLITMHRYNAASRLEGLAVRIAFQLGLHRCPVKLNSLPVKECELRKRLFWSIFCIDRYICIRLGTPLSIRMEDVDVCYPHGERHDLTEQEKTERDDRLDLLEFLSHHADVRGSIMELRNRSTLKDLSNEDDQALDIDAEHSRWWNIVDEYLSNAEQTQTITKAHQVTLIVLRFESILALHRSILATSKKSSFYNAALQRCISASRSIINTLHSALRGYGAFDGSPGQDGYETTPLLWPSFTWAVWMGTFIVIFAATEDQIPRSVACRLADRSIEVLQNLSLRGTGWPEACIIAIQNLIARLKGGPIRSLTVEPSRTTSSAAHGSTSTVLRHATCQYARLPAITNPASHEAVQQEGSRRPSNPTICMSRQPTSAPPIQPNAQKFQHASHIFDTSTNLDAYAFPSSVSQHPNYDFGPSFANHLTGSATFLGIAQQLSDNPIPNDEIMHLFNSEDMPLWMGGEFGFGGGL